MEIGQKLNEYISIHGFASPRFQDRVFYLIPPGNQIDICTNLEFTIGLES